MPTPRVNPLLSTYRGLRYPTSPLGSFDLFRERHGDTYELFTGKSQWTLVTERADLIDHILRTNQRNYAKSEIVTELLASYIGKGLLTVDGEYWRGQRRLISPGFHREKLANLVATVDAEVSAWIDEVPAGSAWEVYGTTLPLALQIMARVLFSGRVTPAELHTVAHSVELGQDDFAKELRQPLLKPWRRLTNSRKGADAENARTIEILLRQIREHRERPGDFDDLLSMLLDSHYDDGSAMSDAQLVDETLVLILAGHETTAISLACTAWLLSRHPDWQARVREEWRTVVGDGSLSAKHLPQLPILTAVVREALRLYPPAYLLSRRAIADDEFDGVHIAAGQTIMASIVGAHRLERNFKDADAFRPERYLERETSVNFAFGGGPRLCVGVHLAMMELQIATGRLVDRYRLTSYGPETLQMEASATMRPASGVWVGLQAI